MKKICDKLFWKDVLEYDEDEFLKIHPEISKKQYDAFWDYQDRRTKIEFRKFLGRINEVNKKCINFMLANEFDDGKKRIVFALISNLKQNHSKEEVIELISNWYEKQNHRPPKQVLIADINRQFNQDYYCGCKSIKTILDSSSLRKLCDACEYNYIQNNP